MSNVLCLCVLGVTLVLGCRQRVIKTCPVPLIDARAREPLPPSIRGTFDCADVIYFSNAC